SVALVDIDNGFFIKYEFCSLLKSESQGVRLNDAVFGVLISTFNYRNHFNLPNKINPNGNRPYLQKNR
ncbi:MAG: hypothetical protein Q8N79_08155, partial [Candidatus Methanoperedens sp.]|nr:hypothetical protein [Candidatus Methanoperedens sp.]